MTDKINLEFPLRFLMNFPPKEMNDFDAISWINERFFDSLMNQFKSYIALELTNPKYREDGAKMLRFILSIEEVERSKWHD